MADVPHSTLTGADLHDNKAHTHPAADVPDVEALNTAETTTTYVLAPDGTGGVEFRAEAGGSGTPGDTVEDETTWGITPDAGASTDYSRADHTHGSPADPGGASFVTYESIISGMSGLVHRWKFEEASGNFADSVGSLTLVKSGAITYSVAGGPVSGASGSIQFGAAGVGKASGVGSIPTGGNARTFVLVFKGPGTNPKQALFNYGTAGATRQWWTAFVNENGGIKYGTVPPGMALDVWGDDASFGNMPAQGLWWHLCAYMYDGSITIATFFDGAWAGHSLGAALNTGSGNFWIGQENNGTSQLGPAIYDDLAVFNRVLNAYELGRLYAALAGDLP